MLTEASLSYTNDDKIPVALDLYAKFPDWFQTIFHSGISAGAICAIVLNLVFNWRSTSTDPVDYHNTGEIDVAGDNVGISGSDAPRGAAFDPRDALAAADPNTSPQTLRILADHDPGLHPFIVTNPSAPKDLCDEIKALGDPKVTSLFDKWDDVTDGKFSSRGQDTPA